MTAANDLAIQRALELPRVEFIDENDGGRGVRLRKGPKKALDALFWIYRSGIMPNLSGIMALTPQDISQDIAMPPQLHKKR